MSFDLSSHKLRFTEYLIQNFNGEKKTTWEDFFYTTEFLRILGEQKF